MKRVFAGIALLLGAAVGAAPDMLWVTKLDFGHDEYGEGVASRGNAIAAAGYVSGGSTMDWLVVKLDQDGNFKWARTYDAGADEEAVSTCIDAKSNVLVAGLGMSSKGARRSGPLHLPGWGRTANPLLAPQTQYYALIAKYDSLGDMRWVRIDTNYVALGIAVDSAGNSYISGTHFVSSSSLDLWLAKFDTLGDTVWTRTYDLAPIEIGYRLALTPSGDIATCDYVGDYSNTFDCLTLKLKPDGDTVWTRRYDRGPNDACSGVAVDPGGDIIITGTSTNSGKATTNDALVLKYDSIGGLRWSKVFSFDEDDGLSGASCDSAGDIYVAGYTGTTSAHDCLTMKLDTAGSMLWSATYGGSGDDAADDVVCDSVGNPIIDGYVTDTTTGSINLLVAEYSPFTAIAESHASGPRPVSASSTISAAPDFVVSVPRSGHYDIRLCDLCGRTRQRVFCGQLNRGAHRFSSAGQPAGMYFVRVAAPDGGISCLRLVLIK